MKNVISKNLGVGFVLGIGLTMLFFTFKDGCNEPPKKIIFTIAPPKIEPKKVGDDRIEEYSNLAPDQKIFGKDITFIYIDAEGFDQLVNKAQFKGFKMYLGYESTAQNAYSLLFSAIDTKNTEYYYTDPKGDKFYLNKTSLCPDAANPNCP